MQKEREAEERKKKQAEEDAAKAYDEFVAAMGGDVAEEAFGHAEKSHRARKSAAFVAAGGKAYVGTRAMEPPSSVERKEQEEAGSKPTPLKRLSTAFGDDLSDQESSPASLTPRKDAQPARKRQALTSFLSELQTEQAERESRLSTLASTTNTSISTLLAHETLSKPGSRDLVSDPLTTNICIVSLPPNVDERSMGEFFRAWGDVATVKIMWPRGEQRERVGGLTGFVAYMTRAEAEHAFKEADGAVWGGSKLKLSWGKAMPLPSRAMYPADRDKHRRENKHALDGSEGGGGGAGGKSAVPKLVVRHRRHPKVDQREQVRSKVLAEFPETQRLFVETVASRIRSNGAHFEQILREREADNPQFGFLFEQHSMLYQYFRMCLDARYDPVAPLAEGEHEGEFSDKGSDTLYSTDSGEESENQRLRFARSSTLSTSSDTLGPLSRRRLICMLRSLTLRRERIARITAFALDHAAAYPAVVGLLTASLLRPSTPIARKLARLYALSDILHNSGTPISNAWRYRAALEAQLPLIFAHLGQVASSLAGRIKREEFKAKVLALLDVWDGWIVVAPHVLDRLRRLFERPPGLENSAAHKEMQPVQDPVHVAADEDVDGEPLTAATVPPPTSTANQEEDDDEDLDGEAL